MTTTGRPEDEGGQGLPITGESLGTPGDAVAGEPFDTNGQDVTSQPSAASPATRSSRHIEVAALKALAHPLRVRLWDALGFGGPATASQLAQRFGESSGSTSYHLRQLARHGFVTEVAGRGTARERWWEVAPDGLTLDLVLDPEDTRDTSPAAQRAMLLVLAEWSRLRRSSLEDWYQRSASGREDPTWDDAASSLFSAMHLTAAELAAVNAELEDVVQRWSGRTKGRRADPPAGTRPVEVQVSAFPLDVPEAGTADGAGTGG